MEKLPSFFYTGSLNVSSLLCRPVHVLLDINVNTQSRHISAGTLHCFIVSVCWAFTVIQTQVLMRVYDDSLWCLNAQWKWLLVKAFV